MKENVRNYKSVTENNKKSVFVIMFTFLTAVIVGFVFYFFDIGTYRIPLALVPFALVLYQIYRTRKCPVCGVKMQRGYLSGPIPGYYYCTKDKVKIDTKVGHAD